MHKGVRQPDPANELHKESGRWPFQQLDCGRSGGSRRRILDVVLNQLNEMYVKSNSPNSSSVPGDHHHPEQRRSMHGLRFRPAAEDGDFFATIGRTSTAPWPLASSCFSSPALTRFRDCPRFSQPSPPQNRPAFPPPDHPLTEIKAVRGF